MISFEGKPPHWVDHEKAKNIRLGEKFFIFSLLAASLLMPRPTTALIGWHQN
jgi:hypothetical protein